MISTISRESGFQSQMLNGEVALADKGYYGDPHFLTPFKRKILEQQQLQWNSIVSKSRVCIEHFFGRVKAFAFTRVEWRHDLRMHEMCFHTLCQILNIDTFFRPIESQ